MKEIIRLGSIAALALAMSAHAHHSFSGNFDINKPAQITGVVSKFRFVNPHVGVDVVVRNPNGTTTQWISEAGAATGFIRQGWNTSTFKVGDTVRITGNASRDGSPMISINTIELLNPADNSVVRTYVAGQGGHPVGDAVKPPPVALIPLKLADGRPNLTGAWTENYNAAGVSGPGGLTALKVPFNAEGAARQAKFDPADDPQIFCEPPGLVRQAGFTPHPVRITQFADRVLLEYEEYAGRREVYFKPQVPKVKGKTNLGNSVARYEGDALVIETRDLRSNQSFINGNWLSDQMTTVETYRRADDPKVGPILSMQMVVTDPGYLTAPLVIRNSKVYAKDYEFTANDCRPPLRKKGTKLPPLSNGASGY